MKKQKEGESPAHPEAVELEILRKDEHQDCLETKATWFSKLFLIYINTLVGLGNKKILNTSDMFDHRPEEHVESSRAKEQRLIEDYKKKKGKPPSYFYGMYLNCRRDFWIMMVLTNIANLIQFAGPFLLKEILKYLADPRIDSSKGWIWASILFGLYLVRTVMQEHGMHVCDRLSSTLLNMLYGRIYDKIMKLSTSAKRFYSSGKVSTYLNVDIYGIYMFSQMMSMMVSSPLILVISIIMVCVELDNAIGLLGPAIIFLGLIIQGKLQLMTNAVRMEQLKYTQQRSQALYEFFSGLKIIKYYAWEQMALNRIAQIRKEESKTIFKQALYRGLTDIIATVIPVFVNIIVFGVYQSRGYKLTPSLVYTVLAYFNMMQLPLRMLALMLMMYTNSKVSIIRLEHYAKAEEIDEESHVDESLPVGSLYIKGDFSWDTKVSFDHNEDEKAIAMRFNRKAMNEAKKEAKKRKKEEKKQKKEEKKRLKALKKNNGQLQGAAGQTDTERNELIHDASPQANQNNSPGKKPAVFDEMKHLTIKDIDFSVKPGEFIAIIGSVGSGKSTFLTSLINEVSSKNKIVRTNGKIAFVPQTAWLMNASVKNNILFFEDYNEAWYQKVIETCQLKPDLEIFPGGDQTEIGERGLNLSGGQKQRVGLARAVYQQADIYIIDDTLSALDSHVGKKIYENVFRGVLRNKTILFVTHALQYINEADRIVVFKDGKIEDVGTFQSLTEQKGNEFNRLVVKLKAKEEEENKEGEKEGPGDISTAEETVLDEVQLKKKKSKRDSLRADDEAKKKAEIDKLQKGGLVKIEEKSEGAIPLRVYIIYLSAGGALVTFLVVLGFSGSTAGRILCDWWLGRWSINEYRFTLEQNVGVYIGLAVITGILIMIRAFLFGLFTLRTANNLQQKLLNVLMKSPLSWYDVTPLGRIISRTSKDQDDLDINLPQNYQFSLTLVLLIIGSVLLTGVVTPLFFVFVGVGLVFYIYFVKQYINASREIKRVELNLKAPLISHFTETLDGIVLIRCQKKEKIFKEKFIEKVNASIRSTYNYQLATRWISFRTNFFSTILIGVNAYLAVLSRTYNYVNDSSLMGLSLTWTFQISLTMPFAVRLMAEVENMMNSVQRIVDYIEKNPSEKPFDTPQPKQSPWPTEGRFVGKNVRYRYRPELDNVIHGIDFSFKKCEKIGVVGRTGSGKSTMTLGILRILELWDDKENGKGTIELDDQIIEDVGLHCLRKNITMIPQDPVLFSGTIRYNIDPFNTYDDDKIKEALVKVHIWNKLPGEQDVLEKTKSEDKAKLASKVSDGGTNFSLGERQLLCMARAIVRNPHVLLMDEATASIDERTDALIQTMIKTEFKNTTVITIAHRLNTIIQYDKIMVLEKGKVAQFGTPLELLQTEGILSTLVKGHGKEYEQRMIYLAKNRDVILEEDMKFEEENEVLVPASKEPEVVEKENDFNDELRSSYQSIADFAMDEGVYLPHSEIGAKRN